jgi:hypothetical protein
VLQTRAVLLRYGCVEGEHRCWVALPNEVPGRWRASAFLGPRRVRRSMLAQRSFAVLTPSLPTQADARADEHCRPRERISARSCRTPSAVPQYAACLPRVAWWNCDESETIPRGHVRAGRASSIAFPRRRRSPLRCRLIRRIGSRRVTTSSLPSPSSRSVLRIR